MTPLGSRFTDDVVPIRPPQLTPTIDTSVGSRFTDVSSYVVVYNKVGGLAIYEPLIHQVYLLKHMLENKSLHKYRYFKDLRPMLIDYTLDTVVDTDDMSFVSKDGSIGYFVDYKHDARIDYNKSQRPQKTNLLYDYAGNKITRFPLPWSGLLAFPPYPAHFSTFDNIQTVQQKQTNYQNGLYVLIKTLPGGKVLSIKLVNDYYTQAPLHFIKVKQQEGDTSNYYLTVLDQQFDVNISREAIKPSDGSYIGYYVTPSSNPIFAQKADINPDGTVTLYINNGTKLEMWPLPM